MQKMLPNKYKSYWLHGFRRFFLKIFPIITYKKLMKDPQGMAKLDFKGTVGMIQNIAIY